MSLCEGTFSRCLQGFLNVHPACSSTSVTHILSSFQGVHGTRRGSWSAELSWKNRQWVRICSLALKLLLSFSNLLLEPYLPVWAPRSSYSKECLEMALDQPCRW